MTIKIHTTHPPYEDGRIYVYGRDIYLAPMKGVRELPFRLCTISETACAEKIARDMVYGWSFQDVFLSLEGMVRDMTDGGEFRNRTCLSMQITTDQFTQLLLSEAKQALESARQRHFWLYPEDSPSV